MRLGTSRIGTVSLPQPVKHYQTNTPPTQNPERTECTKESRTATRNTMYGHTSARVVAWPTPSATVDISRLPISLQSIRTPDDNTALLIEYDYARRTNVLRQQYNVICWRGLCSLLDSHNQREQPLMYVHTDFCSSCIMFKIKYSVEPLYVRRTAHFPLDCLYKD